MRLYKTQIMIDEMNTEISAMGGIQTDQQEAPDN